MMKRRQRGMKRKRERERKIKGEREREIGNREIKGREREGK